MKVLGYPDMDWSANHVCGMCGAELLIEIEDLRYSDWEKYHAKCLVCNETCKPANKLPWFVERWSRGGHVEWPPNHRLFGAKRPRN